MHHCNQAAKRVTHVFSMSDEGAAGTFGASQPGLMQAVTGNIDGDPEQPYTDMSGLEVLPGKTGRHVATGNLSILKRRGFDEGLGFNGGYFFGTDAALTNVGHVSGAVAYYRREKGTPLIHPIRCEAHITARTYAYMLWEGGTEVKRPPIKRRSEDPQISAEVMLVEDVAYMLKKWPALKTACQAQQPEPLPRVSGCIDTRWEYTADAMRAIIGLTVVLERLMALWVSVIEDVQGCVGIEGLSRCRLVETARETKLPRAAVVAAIEADEWACGNFDLSRLCVPH